MNEVKNNLEEKKEKARFVSQMYKDRLKVLRLARDYNQKNDIANAVKAYLKYLKSLSMYFEVDEKDLNPKIFERENNIHEIMLISQVYWDLAKAYDRSPKLANECDRCLKKFLQFSLGFKFQYLNSEILRKYIRKDIMRNKKLFAQAYDRIKVSSDKCYIATHCFGEGHQTVQDLRQFKKILNNSALGLKFIEYYYRLSAPFTFWLQNKPIWNKFFKFLFTPPIYAFSKFLKIFIINK